VKRRKFPPRPPRSAKPTTVTTPVPTHSTARGARLPAKLRKPKLPPRRLPAKPQIARIAEDDEATLIDLLDNLLNRGVVLDADLVLGLADVDLVYVRLTALLAAADRVFRRME